MRSFLLTSLFLAIAFLVALPSASARPTDLEVEFEQLDVSVHRGAVQVSYRIAKSDWRRMKRAGIKPRLNLYTARARRAGFDYRYSVPIERRVGAVAFPRAIKLRGKRAVELRVVGYSSYSRVARTKFGERCAERVRIAVRGHRGHRGHRAKPRRADADLITACGEASKYDVAACIERVQKIDRRYQTSVVRACSKHTNFSSDLKSCIDAAAEIQRFNPAPTVLACGSSTSFTSELFQCVERASSFRRDPSRIIAACDDATRFSSDFNACIDNSRGLGRNAVTIIEVCNENSVWRSDFHRCVEVSAARTRT